MQRSSPLGKNTVHEAKERFLYFKDGRFPRHTKLPTTQRKLRNITFVGLNFKLHPIFQEIQPVTQITL